MLASVFAALLSLSALIVPLLLLFVVVFVLVVVYHAQPARVYMCGCAGLVRSVTLSAVVVGARECARAVARYWGSETARAWGKQAEGRRPFMSLRPFPRVRPRVYPRARGCLLVG